MSTERLLRSGKAPPGQLCRCLVEQSNVNNRTCKTSSWPVLSVIHCDGPTCGVDGLQYNKMDYLDYLSSHNRYGILEFNVSLDIGHFGVSPHITAQQTVMRC